MNLSVWDWPWRPKYYLTRPWKWFSDLFVNLRAAYRRARYGWCYSDAWNYDEYFLTITPQIFRHIADYGCGYPGTGKFTTPESWHDWLHSVADVLESLQEENWYSQNPYEKEFHMQSDAVRKEWVDAQGFTHHTQEPTPEFMEVRAHYFEECKRLEEQRKELLKDTFAQIAENFACLWD